MRDSGVANNQPAKKKVVRRSRPNPVGDRPATRTADLRKAESFKQTRDYYHALAAAEVPRIRDRIDRLYDPKNKRDTEPIKRQGHQASDRVAKAIYAREFAKLMARTGGYFDTKPKVVFSDDVIKGAGADHPRGTNEIRIPNSTLHKAMASNKTERLDASVLLPLHEAVHVQQPTGLPHDQEEGGADMVALSIASRLGYKPRLSFGPYDKYDSAALEEIQDIGWKAFLKRHLGR